MYLQDVRTVDVELWLHTLQLAPGTRSKIRNIMSAVFNHAIRHEWMDRNPITKVRVSAKRLREPDVLTPAEFASLIAMLDLRERAMVMLAGSTGLRRSELVALTWADIDLELMQVNVRRSCVRNHFGDTKTEASRKPVPLHPSVVKYLKAWREESAYATEEDFLFPSLRREGKQPLSPDTLLKKVIRPAVERAGIKNKRIGWHSFRHSLATNLRAAGVDLKTAQELLRHANSRITLEVYTHAISATKREANNRVMQMVLEAGKKQLSAPSSAPSKGAQTKKKEGADCLSTLSSTLADAS
jgi:integrase